MNNLAIILGTALISVMLPSTQAEPMPGGFSDVPTTNAWVMDATSFAVEAQAKTADPKGKPTLVAVVSARQQVVAGMNYWIVMKVKVGGAVRQAEAVVWRKLDGEYRLTSWTWR